MRHRNRPLALLITGIISLIALIFLVYFCTPYTTIGIPENFTNLPFSLERFIQIPPVVVFFFLIAVFLFSIGSYILKSKIHGILIAGLTVIYLIFRLNHLTHPFFLILLLALFFVLELLVSSRK